MAVMARETWTDERLDHLAQRMDERFDHLDSGMQLRFKQVDTEMKAGFARADAEVKLRFQGVDERFQGVDGRFQGMDRRLDRIEGALKDLHADNKAMQNTVTQAIITICATMIGGFAAIVAALIGAAAF